MVAAVAAVVEVVGVDGVDVIAEVDVIVEERGGVVRVG